MKIAIIGIGNVGSTLARRWTALGHHIYLGARIPSSEDAQSLAKTLGQSVTLGTPAEVAKAAEVILLAVPFGAACEVIQSLGNLSGKILIDCTNPLKPDLSGLEVLGHSSGAEQIQTWAKNARVFKAFNTVGANIMENPVFGPNRAVMYFCGDSDADKKTVRELIDSIGFEPIDAGPLVSAHLLEMFALLWIHSAYRFGLGRNFGFHLVKRN